MGGTPDVSVIIPAYNAQSTIGRAIESVRSAGLSVDRWEVVVAPDDGVDYAPVFEKCGNVRCLPPGPVRTGTGAARNRALDAASGSYMAFLDADDTWEPNFLAEAMPVAREDGAAFAPTSVCQNGVELMRLPAGRVIDFETMAATGASFRPVVRREMVGRFATENAQDIFHACELLGLLGGRARVGRAAYRLNLSEGSESRRPEVIARLQSVYAHYIDRLRSGESRCPDEWVSSAVSVFEAKLGLDQAFREQDATDCYYSFIASHRAAAA